MTKCKNPTCNNEIPEKPSMTSSVKQRLYCCTECYWATMNGAKSSPAWSRDHPHKAKGA